MKGPAQLLLFRGCFASGTVRPGRNSCLDGKKQTRCENPTRRRGAIAVSAGGKATIRTVIRDRRDRRANGSEFSPPRPGRVVITPPLAE